MSSFSKTGYKLARMRRAATAASLLALIVATAHGYVLEGPRWSPGTSLVLQLSLGVPLTPLQDGSTTWNQAVAPAVEMWNQNMGAIHVSVVMDANVVPNSN